MNVAVAGFWHLGCVTAACCARHFRVIGVEPDPEILARLNEAKAPIFEPGLDDLIAAGLRSGKLQFSSEPVDADVLWLTYDTPVNEKDESDVEFVFARMRKLLSATAEGATVLISSQLPVGSVARLEAEFPGLEFAYSPENLRVGRAIETFERVDRIVAGVRHERTKVVLERLFAPFSKNILWMTPESAEMVKHGLNAFLALSISFINEIATLCEKVGADATDVAAGLKSDARIGSLSYLSPGAAFHGGTLARDVINLRNLGVDENVALAVIPAIQESNERHRAWALTNLRQRLNPLPGSSVAVLGLTYTANTDTLHRSPGVELCQALHEEGVHVKAFDPAVRVVPRYLDGVLTIEASVEDTLRDVDAVVILTRCPSFREVPWSVHARGRLVLDPNGFLDQEMAGVQAEYLRVGRSR